MNVCHTIIVLKPTFSFTMLENIQIHGYQIYKNFKWNINLFGFDLIGHVLSQHRYLMNILFYTPDKFVISLSLVN